MMNAIRDCKIGDLVRLLATDNGYLVTEYKLANSFEIKKQFDDGVYLGCYNGTWYFGFKERPNHCIHNVHNYNSLPFNLRLPTHNFKYVRTTNYDDYLCRILGKYDNGQNNLLLFPIAMSLISSAMLGKKFSSYSRILKQAKE